MAKDVSDIEFCSVNKSFLLGGFGDVVRDIFGVTARCSSYKALQDISFAVPKGELIGVLGRNGAGKSTLLRVAGGVYTPDSGNVFSRKNPTAIFEMGLFGNQHLTGRRFCERYLEFKGVSKRDIASFLEGIKDFSELDEYFDEPMLTYSAGMQARLMFGVVTALPAEVVLLDEVLSVGDAHFQGKSYRRLMKMIGHGASGIFATHDWFTAVRLCSKIIILNKGKVEFAGTSLEAARKYLDLAPKLSRKVYFKDHAHLIAQSVYYHPGKLFTFSFEVESTIDTPFAVGLALEIPKLAIVVIIKNDAVVQGGMGSYTITLETPDFPVQTPDCYLSLFLSKPRSSAETSSSEIYDQISWTSGDSIRLLNANAYDNRPEGIVYRRFKWRQLERQGQTCA